MLVKRLALEEVTAEASRIVHGTVAEVQAGRDQAGIPATWVTLEVAETLKGAAAGRVTIKQLGAAEPLPDGALGGFAGLPRYAVGEEVVLFLRAESAAGFTSPVGLGQGVYRVRRIDGRRAVRSDKPPGKQDLTNFLAEVTRLTGR